jgi:hypothetical protein
MDDEVFKALAHDGRRTLLDRLFERDGQTLGELEEALPGMTRFGVMKHLPGGGLQLAIDGLDVGPDGVDRDVQLAADVPVRQRGRKQP